MASSSGATNCQLLDAAYKGNLHRLKELAAKLDNVKGMANTIVGIKDPMGLSATHLAALQGNLDVCKFLIDDLNLDVDVKDTRQGKTPLHCAILGRHFCTASYLLEKGANLDMGDDTGATSLHYAAAYGDKKLLHMLLSRGSNVDALSLEGTPLERAALNQKPEAVELLLQYRANPNLTYHNVCSPLLVSVGVQSFDCMELLLKAGADPNVCELGPSPLELAATLGQSNMVLSLLKAGADPNVTNEVGLTPIEMAAVKGYNEVVEILLPMTKPIFNLFEVEPWWNYETCAF